MFMRCYALCVLLLVTTAVTASEITVSAASSLTNAFQEIARQYEAKHPDTKVFLNFAASGVLQQQIANGAPVDVFASADEKTMNQIVEAGFIHNDSIKRFAKNQLVVITPAASKNKPLQLTDLQQDTFTRIALSHPESVPTGHYSKTALEHAGLWQSLQTKIIRTQNVRHSLDYVARNEVDAGFVYQSDAILLPDKVQIAFGVETPDNIFYPIAMLRHSPNTHEASKFIDYVLSPSGQAILASYGFLAP